MLDADHFIWISYRGSVSWIQMRVGSLLVTVFSWCLKMYVIHCLGVGYLLRLYWYVMESIYMCFLSSIFKIKMEISQQVCWCIHFMIVSSIPKPTLETKNIYIIWSLWFPSIRQCKMWNTYIMFHFIWKMTTWASYTHTKNTFPCGWWHQILYSLFLIPMGTKHLLSSPDSNLI